MVAVCLQVDPPRESEEKKGELELVEDEETSVRSHFMPLFFILFSA